MEVIQLLIRPKLLDLAVRKNMPEISQVIIRNIPISQIGDLIY